MRGILSLVGIGLLGIAVQAGCADQDPPPPPRVAAPLAGEVTVRPMLEKPLPSQEREDLPPPPFDDVPIVSQATPEQRAFVDAYARVGRPRILVFVNRTLEGDVIPVNSDQPLATVEHRVNSSAGVDVETHSSHTEGYWRDQHADQNTRLHTNGPGDYRETTDIYLHPGDYDEAFAKSIDYEAMENILTDWLGSQGRVALISPTMARQRLTDQQVKELQSGRPRTLGEIAQRLDADVLVQVQAHATRQAGPGPGVRLVAEAMNLRGGESIGRAVVDVPPPLDKPQTNKYTRFIARKLMDGMIGSWQAFGARAPAKDAGTGAAEPAPPPGSNSPAPPPPPASDLPPVAPVPQSQPAFPADK